MPLQIVNEGATLRFSGDTFDYKDLIKALPGAKWDPAAKVWTAPATADLTAIRAYKPQPWKPRTREEWTKEEWRDYCLKWNKRGSPGKCCKNASAFEQYEQGPTCWRCALHGETISSWTGD